MVPHNRRSANGGAPIVKGVRFTSAEFGNVEAAMVARKLPDVSSLLRKLVEEDRAAAALRLRKAREAAGMGQRALARALGYEHHSIVGQMERCLIPLTEPARAWMEEQQAKGGSAA
jgi:hypothetical protein